MKHQLLKFSVVFFCGILLAGFAHAASVIQVKGNKALVSLEGLPVQPGSEVYAINAEQKRKGLLRISQVKGDKAVADVLQGSAQPGMMIIIKSSAPVAAPAYGGSYDPANYGGRDRYPMKKKSNMGWGVLGGFAMNSMAVTAKNGVLGSPGAAGESLSMKGSSFNLKGFFDYQMSPSFTLRGATGLETLAVTGSVGDPNNCSGSTSCALSLNYITFEGDAQYNLSNTGNRYWIGAGFGFLLAMSTGNNITSLQAASTNQVLLFGGGADISLGHTSYIPIVVEYGMFPFAGISLSSIYLRAGYGMRF